ncbi:MAG: terminase small subunit [Christensenella sp.]
MTNKQKRFCEEYCKDFDAGAALVRAGYSENRAQTTADFMLKMPKVQEYIEKLKIATSKRAVYTEEILEYFTKLMRDEIFEQHIETDRDTGEERVIRQPVKVSDRTKAAEFLAKYYKLMGDKDEGAQGETVRIEMDEKVKKWAV